MDVNETPEPVVVKTTFPAEQRSTKQELEHRLKKRKQSVRCPKCGKLVVSLEIHEQFPLDCE